MTDKVITLAEALQQQAEAQRSFEAIARSLSSARARRLERLWQANQLVAELSQEESK